MTLGTASGSVDLDGVSALTTGPEHLRRVPHSFATGILSTRHILGPGSGEVYRGVATGLSCPAEEGHATIV